MSIKVPSLKEMMEQGVHFGHVAKYWHPKAAPYIFLRRDKIHILNLEKTKEALEQILPKITEEIKAGKIFLIVGTKRQIRSIIKEVGLKVGMPYVYLRWLGGILTNFDVMKQSIKRMKEIEEMLASEESRLMIKKEKLNYQRQLLRMKEKFGGLVDLKKLPDYLLVIDPHYEKSAVKEAKALEIKIIAILDTNSDPISIDYVIPANDDAKKSVELIMNLVEQAILEGMSNIKTQNSKPQVKA